MSSTSGERRRRPRSIARTAAWRTSRTVENSGQPIRIEQDARFSYFDSLDAKAGVVLGFAAAIAALIDPNGDILVDMARTIAVLGGATAMVSFWPRTAPQTDMRALRDLYLGAEPDFTKLALLDMRAMLEEVDVRVRRKARLLRIAMVTLAAAALLAAAGAALE